MALTYKPPLFSSKISSSSSPSPSKPYSFTFTLSSKTPKPFSKALLSSNPNPNPFPSNPSFKTPQILPPLPAKSSIPDLTPPSPSPKSLKSRLAAGEQLYGMFLLSFSPTLAEIAGFSGYDFVVVDMEHGFGGISSALPVLHALAATGTPAILRPPESDPAWVKKALDLGPQGLMFPMIETPKDAKKAVSYCRFPPRGVRGSAHPLIRGSKYGIDDGYLGSYEDEILIMCQVESEEGVKRIEEITAVEGVDCIQMGPLDLSASLGYLWDPGHKKVKEVLYKAEKGVLGVKEGAFLAGFAMPHDGPEQLRKRGYSMISGAVDLGLFRSAAVEDVRRFKEKGSDGVESDAGEDVKEKEEKYWSE